MRIREDYILRKIGNDYIVFPVGENSNKEIIVKLNETGAFFWAKMSSESLYEDIVNDLLENFEVEAEVAIQDLNYFIKICKENNFFEGD